MTLVCSCLHLSTGTEHQTERNGAQKMVIVNTSSHIGIEVHNSVMNDVYEMHTKNRRTMSELHIDITSVETRTPLEQATQIGKALCGSLFSNICFKNGPGFTSLNNGILYTPPTTSMERFQIYKKDWIIGYPLKVTPFKKCI